MNKHIIPYDSFHHIESFSCDCNPQVVISEGEEQYIHNEISTPGISNSTFTLRFPEKYYSNNTQNIKSEE